jgi:hypothetical protein
MANKYNNIVKKALESLAKQNINEGIYAYKGKERISEDLMKRLRTNETSLGNNPILPAREEVSFLERVMVEKFNRVVKEYKRAFDVDEIDTAQSMLEMQSLVMECMKMEGKHRDKLADIAVNMIREEYNVSEELLEINAEIVDPQHIDSSQFEENKLPRVVEMEFEDHAQMEDTGKEVDKRRFINAMAQGAAMRTNHMYHMAGDELAECNPKLPNAYNKMMSNINYLYMANPDMNAAVPSGNIDVNYSGDKPVINAKAITFPVLVHEIVKGVMEVLSAHALPEDNQLAEYCMAKADAGIFEVDDMIIGETLWERFTNMLEVDDFSNKHHIYAEMCSKPTNEFIYDMREVMANTKRGKAIIQEISEKVREDIKRDEYMSEYGDEPYNDLDSLLGDINPEDIIN